MARRDIGEINAGSMADIAFLLLIFFLVTTTMDFDQGIAKVLPQKPPENMPPVILLERNVLSIQANFNDELLVNGEQLQVADLKEKVIEFMKNEKDDELLPIMDDVNKTTCEDRIKTLKQNIEENPDNESIEVWQSDLKEWEARLNAVAVVGPYRVIPKLSVISVQTDNGTSYSYYMKIQDALKGAINQLRDEWCMKAYNVKYTALKETEVADMDKIRVIRAIVPERIAEMEPRNIQEF
jgi:biopolymer transport protein ExbD